MEKAMAPHSSTLAWKIPWTEEPGRLQSMGLLRVGHDWATSLSLFTFMHWRRKWQPTPVFLPGESQGQRSLVGCRPLGRTEQQHGQGTLQHTWHILIFIISCKYQYYPIFQIRKLKPSHAFPQDHMVTGKMATKQILRIWLQRLYSVIYKVSHFWKVIQPLWASISISVTVKR